MGLCWTFVALGLLMLAGDSLATVDQNKLAELVEEILKRYKPSYLDSTCTRRFRMFSLAVNIPYNKDADKYDMGLVTDRGDAVTRTILDCKVYISATVVAATVLKWPDVLKQCPCEEVMWPLKNCQRAKTWADVGRMCRNAFYDGQAEHAEYRTLQNLDTLVRHSDNADKENNLLLFYVHASPCDKRCTSLTSKWSILENIKQIRNWKNYAVVFSKVFQPLSGEHIPEEVSRGALERLGERIGLTNIFRCDGLGTVRCTCCSSKNGVHPYCYSDDSQSYSRSQRKRWNTGRRNVERSGTRKRNKHYGGGKMAWMSWA